MSTHAPHGLRPFGTRSPWLVLAAPQFLSTAQAVVLRSPPGTAEFCPVKWGVFPDGTPDISMDASLLEGRDVMFIGDLQTDILSFFAVAYAIPRYLARTFVCVVPYFPTGTMERVEKEGEVATAKTLARIVSATPSPQVGDTTYVFFEMHSLATRFYFSDRVKVLLATAIPLLLQHLDLIKRKEGKYPVICFPDDGAKKRFRKFFSSEDSGERQFDLAVCAKTRVGDRREIILNEGDVKDRSVVIVDDLAQSGGTLRSARQVLYASGARRVSAYVTHGVFPGNSWKKFLVDSQGIELVTKEKGFHEFLMTDSIPASVRAIGSARPYVVLSVADALTTMMHGKLLPIKGTARESHL